MKKYLSVIALFIAFSATSQNSFSVASIPSEMKEKANSIIQNEKFVVTIESPKKMISSHSFVVTVLNKNGNRHWSPFVYYNDAIKIKSAEAIIYDANGEQLEKFKKKEFLDLSAVDGGTLYSDNRVLFCNYTPTEYPYTVSFKYVTEAKNTAFIRPFRPMGDYNSGVMNSEYTINYAPGVSLKHKVFDVDQQISISNQGSSMQLSASNLRPVSSEQLSPRFEEVTPYVLFSLDRFSLKGVEGTGSNWKEFGSWMNQSLLQDVQDLSEATKLEIKTLVASSTTLEEKARKVYAYVQENTRYISVQIGIGGWKPMTAMEVDQLGYGDCKALTNYTKALLEVAGVPSYYTVVYGNTAKTDIQADFTSMQGNHVILAIPDQDDTIWLECTSQSIPFGFLGDWTDDRDVLMITPEGGEIGHTMRYDYKENELLTEGICVLDASGNIGANIDLISTGIQYDNRFFIETKTKDEKDEFYKEYWDYVDNISLKRIVHTNNKEEVSFKEHIEFAARSYTSTIGDDMILNVNILNRATFIPKRYKNRKLPLVIERGFVDTDEVTIELPEGYSLKSMPEPLTVKTKFGEYASRVSQMPDGTLLYSRNFTLFEGTFQKEDYNAYRQFRKKVAKHDNQKLIITKQS